MQELKDILNIYIFMFHHYYGNGVWIILAGISALFLLIRGTSRERFLVIASLTVYAFIFNPVLYKYLYSDIVFWRLFWLVPTFILIPAGLAEALKQLKNVYMRLALTAATIAVIIFFGTNVFSNLARDSYTGLFKLPRGTESVGAYMLSVDDHPRCIVANGLLTSIRLYSGNIEPMYGRDVDGYVHQASALSHQISDSMNEDAPNYDLIFNTARLYGYNFVVNYENRPASEDVLSRYGYEFVLNTEGYNIYYNPYVDQPLENDDLLITQYGRDDYDKPSMFYTITDLDNDFIIIDGGNPDEADYVLNTIRANGNHVDTWILTHPHEDHAGAFMEIYQNYVITGEITVDNIYTIDIDSEYYEQIVQPWDNIEFYRSFVSAMESLDNVTYVERGNTYQAGNVTFKVYNTFTEESYDIPTGSLPNACTMVLEVFGPNGEQGESMLFLGDLEQDNADLMVSLFGDELQADYVQAAHHGQNVDYSFYELIGASTVTVDAPAWLRLENPDSHTSYEHIQWFNVEGWNVLTFDSTPNSIILHANP